MLVVMLITAVENTDCVFATREIVDKRVGREDITRALRADGLATTIRVLAEGRQRLANSPVQEHALIEIAKVANRRLADHVANANPIATARTGAFGR